jgi:ERCC4-related helicase
VRTNGDAWDADEEMAADEYEEYEEEVVDQATASQTIHELEAEIRILEGLEEQARQVVRSGHDRKWEELSRLLQDTPQMHEEGGRQRKLIIFTEYKDTLRYLATRIRGLLGSEEAVVTMGAIYGRSGGRSRRCSGAIRRCGSSSPPTQPGRA